MIYGKPETHLLIRISKVYFSQKKRQATNFSVYVVHVFLAR